MRVLVVVAQTVVIYAFLLLATRHSSRRSLASLTPIGYLSVVLLGSAVESALYNGESSVWAGIVSAGSLIAMNRLISAGAMRWPRLHAWLAGGPIILVQDGQVIRSHLERIHLTDDGLRAALRRRGYYQLADVRLAILETDGSVGVIPVARDKRLIDSDDCASQRADSGNRSD